MFIKNNFSIINARHWETEICPLPLLYMSLKKSYNDLHEMSTLTS